MRRLVAVVAAVVLMVVAVPAAQADPAVLACNTSFTLSYGTTVNPVAQTPVNVSLTGSATGCVGAAGLDHAVVTGTGSGTANCLAVVTLTGTAYFAWDTGETSVLEYTVNTNPLSSVPLGLNAHVVSGPLTGTTGRDVPVLDVSANPCQGLSANASLAFFLPV